MLECEPRINEDLRVKLAMVPKNLNQRKKMTLEILVVFHDLKVFGYYAVVDVVVEFVVEVGVDEVVVLELCVAVGVVVVVEVDVNLERFVGKVTLIEVDC